MAQINTTTTVDTYTSTRTGIQLTVDQQSNTVQIGNFVTDVTVNPYIAPQLVSFYATGLRPNQRVHAFFDSVLVDNYCAPGVYAGGDTSLANSVSLTATWGSPLVSDSAGTLAGQFNIPATTFKTGDRIFELADVTNLAQGNDAITTSATANFTASNITVTKQGATLTTINPQISVIPVSNTVVTTNTSVTTSLAGDVVNIDAQYEPIAQGLSINTPNGEAGVYATSLTLWFKQKSQSQKNGVTIYICETSVGYPDNTKIIPFSTVHLPYESINVSTDSVSNPTVFTFESPVFLNNGIEYAFVVRPDNGDPDYFVYSANLGDNDIATGIQVFTQPVIGTAFYGATASQWSALQTEYIKFTLNIANFTASAGDVYFNNGDDEYLSFFNVGFANTSVAILPGDIVYQSANSLSNSMNGTAQTSVYSTVRYYDNVKNVLYTNYSTGNFVANGFVQIHRFANAAVQTSPGPNNVTIIAYGNTGPFYQPVVDAFVPRIAPLTPAGTKIAIDYKGTSNSYTVDSTGTQIGIGAETEFYDQERILVSRSQEVSNMSGNKSSTLHVKLNSDSVLLSPLLDTVKIGGQVVGNQVDKVQDIYNEYYSNGGSKSKYISQIVTLAPGQDAQDLQVSITAHRPPGSDIKVYAKFVNGQDPDPISAKTWTPLVNQGYNVYSTPTNPADVQTFNYSTFPYYPMIASNGTITVANTSNTITGTSTQFGQAGDIQVGMWVNMLANSTFSEQSRQVTAIASNTSLSINAPFNGNYTGQPIFIVSPPTTAWLSANLITQLANSTGAFANSGGAVVTVSTSTTNNTITGSSNANFTALIPGQIINVGGYSQAIVSITNSTSLSVGKPWPVALSGANGYIISQNGLTYLNANNTLYTTFKQFQLKVVVQSNDSSKVPILNDLSALALQL